MKLKLLSAFFGLPMMTFLVLMMWAGLFKNPTSESANTEKTPAVVMSEPLSDGLIEAQIYLADNLGYLIEIQFSPEASSTIAATMAPDVSMAMVDTHMDGFTLPMELVGAGQWRSKGKMPMAGKWNMSVGYGDEFVETTFDVR